MARRSLSDRNIRSLMKTGGGKSYIITIPIEYIKELGWRENQKLEVKKYGDRITIKDWTE